MLEGAPVSVRAFCLQDWTSWEAFIVALHLKQAGGEGWARESAALEGVRSPLVAAMLAEEAWCDCAQLGTAQRKLVHSLLERRELEAAVASREAQGGDGVDHGSDLFALAPYARHPQFLMLRSSPAVLTDVACGIEGSGGDDGSSGADRTARSARFASRLRALEAASLPDLPGLAALVAAHPQDLLDGAAAMGQGQRALAAHYAPHRAAQLVAIEELRPEVEGPGGGGSVPFWSRRLFVYQPVFLTVLLLKALDPPQHAAAVAAWRAGEPELWSLATQSQRAAFRRAAAAMARASSPLSPAVGCENACLGISSESVSWL